MKKIRHYQVEVTDPADSGMIGHERKFVVTEFDVIAENDRYIAINDFCFTSIRKEKCSYDKYLNKVSIHLSANDRVWGSRITYSLYTDGTKRASTIRKEIQAEVAKKFGFFLGKIDLSFIDDKVAA